MGACSTAVSKMSTTFKCAGPCGWDGIPMFMLGETVYRQDGTEEYYCKDCKKFRTKIRARKVGGPTGALPETEKLSKKCYGPCKRTLSMDDFYRDKNRRDGRQPRCKECQRAMEKIWHAEHPEKQAMYAKRSYLRRRNDPRAELE